MSAAFDGAAGVGSLVLPPAFSLVAPPAGADAFAFACRIAGGHGAGTLVWSPHPDRLDVAVVLEPDEPLATARRAFLVGMGALADAVAVAAPPDKPLVIAWPDTIRFDGARLGGGRLGWPEGGAEHDVPAHLVFGSSLVASKARDGDPGLTPDSTSFEEEGFEPGSDVAVVEALARYLMRGFDTWREDSFAAAAAGYMARLVPPDPGARPTLDDVGDLVAGDGSGCRRALLPALRAPSWLDPRTGSVRL